MNNQLPLAGSRFRIRMIALLEFVKGMLALALGFGLLASLDESLIEAAQELVIGLHLDPSSRLPDAFIDAISNVHQAQLGLVVASAVAYALVRFSEAYGLWRERRWAAWVSALSGAIYLPIEAYELSKGVSLFRVSAAAANAFIVAYMALLLWRSQRSHIAK